MSDLTSTSKAWQWVLWMTIRNGHQPLRAFYSLLVIWIVGFTLSGWGYQARVMLPTEKSAFEKFEAVQTVPAQYDQFCALTYAIDTSLPIINFGQRKVAPGLRPSFCAKQGQRPCAARSRSRSWETFYVKRTLRRIGISSALRSSRICSDL